MDKLHITCTRLVQKLLRHMHFNIQSSAYAVEIRSAVLLSFAIQCWANCVDFCYSVALVTTGSKLPEHFKNTLKVFRIIKFTITMTYMIEVKYLANIFQPKNAIPCASFDTVYVMFSDKGMVYLAYTQGYS